MGRPAKTVIKRAKFQLPARVYRAIYPLIQKHAAMRGISTSKLVNDILTIWLYNATPRATLDFFNTHHTPPFGPDQGPRAKALEVLNELCAQKRDEGFNRWAAQNTRPSMYGRGIDATNNTVVTYYERSAHRGGFEDSAYSMPHEVLSNLAPYDAYGVKYSLPPFPKDMPPGYLASMGWAKDRPLDDVGYWLKFAANEAKPIVPSDDN